MAENALTLKDFRIFFGYATLAEFSADWKRLSDQDKKDIRQGIQDGTYNY
jgi:hypothetical protein